jgi:hypothetical protein
LLRSSLTTLLIVQSRGAGPTEALVVEVQVRLKVAFFGQELVPTSHLQEESGREKMKLRQIRCIKATVLFVRRKLPMSARGVNMGEVSLEGVRPLTFVLPRLVDHASPVTCSNNMTGIRLNSAADMIFIVICASTAVLKSGKIRLIPCRIA